MNEIPVKALFCLRAELIMMMYELIQLTVQNSHCFLLWLILDLLCY